MSAKNLIRITVFANRNPKISEEEFHKHWAEKHAPLVSSWLQRHGVVKYTQVRLWLITTATRCNSLQLPGTHYNRPQEPNQPANFVIRRHG
jgi:hypothetical protein